MLLWRQRHICTCESIPTSKCIVLFFTHRWHFNFIHRLKDLIAEVDFLITEKYYSRSFLKLKFEWSRNTCWEHDAFHEERVNWLYQKCTLVESHRNFLVFCYMKCIFRHDMSVIHSLNTSYFMLCIHLCCYDQCFCSILS